MWFLERTGFPLVNFSLLNLDIDIHKKDKKLIITIYFFENTRNELIRKHRRRRFNNIRNDKGWKMSREYRIWLTMGFDCCQSQNWTFSFVSSICWWTMPSWFNLNGSSSYRIWQRRHHLHHLRFLFARGSSDTSSLKPRVNIRNDKGRKMPRVNRIWPTLG